MYNLYVGHVIKTYRYNMCWVSIHQLLTEPDEVIVASAYNVLPFFKFWTCGLKLFHSYRYMSYALMLKKKKEKLEIYIPTAQLRHTHSGCYTECDVCFQGFQMFLRIVHFHLQVSRVCLKV